MFFMCYKFSMLALEKLRMFADEAGLGFMLSLKKNSSKHEIPFSQIPGSVYSLLIAN